jgi:hypothetical protein
MFYIFFTWNIFSWSYFYISVQFLNTKVTLEVATSRTPAARTSVKQTKQCACNSKAKQHHVLYQQQGRQHSWDASNNEQQQQQHGCQHQHGCQRLKYPAVCGCLQGPPQEQGRKKQLLIRQFVEFL